MPADWLKQIRPWLPLILTAAGIMFLGAVVIWLGLTLMFSMMEW